MSDGGATSWDGEHPELEVRLETGTSRLQVSVQHPARAGSGKEKTCASG
jgi:hypothetical protein